jgi:predicted Abi (CAAX) family protease
MLISKFLSVKWHRINVDSLNQKLLNIFFLPAFGLLLTFMTALGSDFTSGSNLVENVWWIKMAMLRDLSMKLLIKASKKKLE